MAFKQKYRIQNWSAYNKALVSRGSLTIWFDDESVAKWYNSVPSSKRGRSQDYSNTAITCALTLRNLFHLTLRSTQGFVNSLIKLLHLPVVSPNYSTLCRRQATLTLPTYKNKTNEPLHLVVDSSGIKIFGEGEWKMHKYGIGKRRTWRKLHIAVDEATQDVVMCVTTYSNIHDGDILSLLLPSKDELRISQVTGDGAYDTHDCYVSVVNAGARPCFPPRKHAARHKPIDKAYQLRNNTIGRVREHGLKKWKEKNNYNRRNLVETAFSRLKKIFGKYVASRTFANQAMELKLRCNILNKINSLGMPVSVRS